MTDRDELIDRLYAIACQHADEWISLDGIAFSVKQICIEAGKMLEADDAKYTYE